ncbi:MAG: glycosyltransferase [Cytophagales bacterium]|nr:glycosyltransferase [Cytophagales bacterium]
MQEAPPQISIITVCYQDLAHLEHTVRSIAAQTYAAKEHLIVDGASSDGTVVYLESLGNQIRWVSEPDQGVYDAMNKGLRMARGEYLLFINAGDELADERVLERLFAVSSKADVLYGETLVLNRQRQIIGTRTELTSRKLPAHLSKSDF